jgi:signal transduction histidine kinase
MPFRLLVVDDDENNLRFLQDLFEETHHVTCARNGQDVIDLLSTNTFDLVLLDMKMPGINGFTVLEHIRNDPQTTHLPVIMISSTDDNRDVVRGLDLGANDFITRPLDVDILLARVNTQRMLKQLYDERQQTIDRLEAIRTLQDQLSRMVSHDLKAPLSTIRMAEHILRRAVGEDEEALTTLDTMMKTTDDMQQVIDDFLDVAVMQAGKLKLRLEAVPVEQVIWDVVMQYTIAARNKDIHLEITPGAGDLLVDVVRMRQVLGNLVSNAIKYSPSGSTTRLWTEIRGDRLRIQVADQGPGIPVEERGRLFEEFGALSTNPTAGESSTGLGLWIARHLTTLHGGTVGYECPPDGGSIFWVELPRNQAEDESRT